MAPGGPFRPENDKSKKGKWLKAKAERLKNYEVYCRTNLPPLMARLIATFTICGNIEGLCPHYARPKWCQNYIIGEIHVRYSYDLKKLHPDQICEFI